jgi:hypothetical protein
MEALREFSVCRDTLRPRSPLLKHSDTDVIYDYVPNTFGAISDNIDSWNTVVKQLKKMGVILKAVTCGLTGK